MLPRLARLLAILAAVQILGGHWVVLQSVAWMGMVLDYSRHNSLPAAIERTFDGAHPCDLCKTVSKGRGEEQQQEMAKLAVKFEATLVVRAPLLPPQSRSFEYPPLRQTRTTLVFPPLTPPPPAA